MIKVNLEFYGSHSIVNFYLALLYFCFFNFNPTQGANFIFLCLLENQIEHQLNVCCFNKHLLLDTSYSIFSNDLTFLFISSSPEFIFIQCYKRKNLSTAG